MNCINCFVFSCDIVESFIPDAFTRLLTNINKQEADSGLLPQKWRQVYDKLETTKEEQTLTRQSSLSTQMVRQVGETLHKKSTLDILVRGKQTRSADVTSIYNQSHKFEKHTFTTLANCDTCNGILLGKVR